MNIFNLYVYLYSPHTFKKISVYLKKCEIERFICVVCVFKKNLKFKDNVVHRKNTKNLCISLDFNLS